MCLELENSDKDPYLENFQGQSTKLFVRLFEFLKTTEHLITSGIL